jgi:hypothetical protein
MPRWLANTLRVLGLILVIGTTFIASVTLLFMSICAGSSEGPSGPGFPYFLGAIATVVVGVWITVLLARAISNSTAAVLATPRYAVAPSGYGGSVPPPPIAAQRAWFREPLSLSPEAGKKVHSLVWMMGAQIVVSFLCWFLAQNYFSRTVGSVSSKSWLLMLLVPFFLYRFPYLLLIYSFLRKPENRTLIYALAVPPMLALGATFNLGAVIYAYVQNPVGLLLLCVPWCLHIVIAVLAWKAVREAELRPDSSSLLRAGLVSFGYLLLLHLATPFLFFLFIRS